MSQLLLLTLFVIAWCYAPACAEITATPSNIVLIMAYDPEPLDIGCHGGEIQPPHLDSLGSRTNAVYSHLDLQLEIDPVTETVR